MDIRLLPIVRSHAHRLTSTSYKATTNVALQHLTYVTNESATRCVVLFIHAYAIRSEQLNSSDNSYQHIRLLPTHPHLVSADFIHLLPVATSADPHIRLLPVPRIEAVSILALHYFANVGLRSLASAALSLLRCVHCIRCIACVVLD